LRTPVPAGLVLSLTVLVSGCGPGAGPVAPSAPSPSSPDATPAPPGPDSPKTKAVPSGPYILR
jgi:hypothetical protein